MLRRHSSSPISAPCRLEWRPSWWLQAALTLLGLLAVVSVFLSDMPLLPASILALLAIAGAARLIRRERNARRHELLVPHSALPACVDGCAVTDLLLQCRGPLTMVSWRDGRRRRSLLFWPDTLDTAQRRELRLAVEAQRISQLPRQMAP